MMHTYHFIDYFHLNSEIPLLFEDGEDCKMVPLYSWTWWVVHLLQRDWAGYPWRARRLRPSKHSLAFFFFFFLSLTFQIRLNLSTCFFTIKKGRESGWSPWRSTPFLASPDCPARLAANPASRWDPSTWDSWCHPAITSLTHRTPTVTFSSPFRRFGSFASAASCPPWPWPSRFPPGNVSVMYLS